VFAGIHFQTAVRVGYPLGTQVGSWVADRSLQPTKGSANAMRMASASR